MIMQGTSTRRLQLQLEEIVLRDCKKICLPWDTEKKKKKAVV